MEFLELPPAYQKGCQFIESKCRKLIENAHLKIDEITWGKLNLSFCHLVIVIGNQTHSVKFGKIALVQFEKQDMQRSICCKLNYFVGQMKIAKNTTSIQRTPNL